MKIRIKKLSVQYKEMASKFTGQTEKNTQIFIGGEDGLDYSALDKAERTWTKDWKVGDEIDFEVIENLSKDGTKIYRNIQRPKMMAYQADRFAKIEARLDALEKKMALGKFADMAGAPEKVADLPWEAK